jgi:hypothetical protein
MKKVLLSAVMVLFMITASVAAEIDGAWKGYIEGQYNITVTLKTQGGKVTGTLAIVDNNPKSENPDDTGYSPYVAAQIGKNEIKDGKVEGENITFTCMFNDKPVIYKGVIQGEKIVLTTTFGSQNVKSTLTKAKV